MAEKTKNFLAILAVAIIIAIVGHVVSVISFNNREHTTHGADSSQSVVMALDDRADSTSSWLKRDFDMNGKTVDLSEADSVLSDKNGRIIH